MLPHPPVEIYGIGAVDVNKLAGGSKPVLQPCLRRDDGTLRTSAGIALCLRNTGTVKLAVSLVLHVAARYIAPAVHKPVVFGAVARGAVFDPSVGEFLFQFSIYVPFRPHIDGVPFAQLARIHFEAVVMLSNRRDIPGAAFCKKLCPLLRIIVFRLNCGMKSLYPKSRP